MGDVPDVDCLGIEPVGRLINEDLCGGVGGDFPKVVEGILLERIESSRKLYVLPPDVDKAGRPGKGRNGELSVLAEETLEDLSPFVVRKNHPFSGRDCLAGREHHPPLHTTSPRSPKRRTLETPTKERHKKKHKHRDPHTIKITRDKRNFP